MQRVRVCEGKRQVTVRWLTRTMIVSRSMVKGITHEEERINGQTACFSARPGEGIYMMQVQHEETSMLQIG